MWSVKDTVLHNACSKLQYRWALILIFKSLSVSRNTGKSTLRDGYPVRNLSCLPAVGLCFFAWVVVFVVAFLFSFIFITFWLLRCLWISFTLTYLSSWKVWLNLWYPYLKTRLLEWQLLHGGTAKVAAACAGKRGYCSAPRCCGCLALFSVRLCLRFCSLTLG